MDKKNTDFESSLTNVHLGDIVVLPDGRGLTTRLKAILPQSVGSMQGFLIAGEMEVLLSIPANDTSPVNVYVPIDYLPFEKSKYRTVYEGVASYWAPHLPALSGAMGEIAYRVIEVFGSIDPVVLVYRGHELIVFIRATFAWSKDLEVLYMDRSSDNEVEVTRYAGVIPDYSPAAPTTAPVKRPLRKPVPVGRS